MINNQPWDEAAAWPEHSTATHAAAA
jgi:hypothetical protein